MNKLTHEFVLEDVDIKNELLSDVVEDDSICKATRGEH